MRVSDDPKIALYVRSEESVRPCSAHTIRASTPKNPFHSAPTPNIAPVWTIVVSSLPLRKPMNTAILGTVSVNASFLAVSLWYWSSPSSCIPRLGGVARELQKACGESPFAPPETAGPLVRRKKVFPASRRLVLPRNPLHAWKSFRTPRNTSGDRFFRAPFPLRL